MHTSISRRVMLASAIGFYATAALAQTAAPGAKFTPEAFAAAQAAGKAIVVEVSAPWCPTCKWQAPIINTLMRKPDMQDIALLKVDFDSQKDVLRSLNVTMQSTLIAFKGKAETSRSVGDTTAAGIEKLFRSAI